MFLPYHTMLFLPHPDQCERVAKFELARNCRLGVVSFPTSTNSIRRHLSSSSRTAVLHQHQSSQTSSAFKLPPTYNPPFSPFHLNSINTSPPCLAPKQDQARLSEMLWRVKVSYLLLSPRVDRFDCWSIFAPLSRLVSTGLQKLRYYCQICEKQCRDV